jgi:hypothetical protein
MDNGDQQIEQATNPRSEPSGKKIETVAEAASTVQTVDPRSFAPPKKTLLEKAKSLVDPAKDVGDVKDYKEQHAIAIALIITWTFAVSACLILIGIYLILRRSPEDAKSLLASAAPMLKEAGTFLSSVFGPLLAFVLGYYFGEKKARS